MSKALCIVFFIGFLSFVSADDQKILGSFFEQCPYAETTCRAYASISITGRGNYKTQNACMTKSEATCEAVSVADSCLAVEKFEQRDVCTTDWIRRVAECSATASVKAITKTLAQSLCTGASIESCGTARANAKALACSVAASFVNILVSGNNAIISFECDVKLAVIVQALASASAASASKVCSGGDGIEQIDVDPQSAIAIQEAFTEAIGACYYVCTPFVAVSFASGSTEGSIEPSQESTSQTSVSFGDGIGQVRENPIYP